MSVNIIIDERPLSVDPGITILQAARQNGIEIPTLCDFPGLPAHGSCRMCVVEIQGQPGTPTACTTPVVEGMQILTNSPKVQALRREILQMLLSEHPSSCLICPENSHCDECMVTLRKAGVTTGCRSCPKDAQCELQTLVQTTGPAEMGYPVHYRMLPVEKQDPFFDRDYNLCVLCGRCIRACEELHFAHPLAYIGRGTHTLPGPAFHRTHLAAGCTFCGACLDVCPTGALSEKTCKWDGKPEAETSSTCALCGLGCSLTLLSKNNRVMSSRPGHSKGIRAAGSDLLCVHGRFGLPELVNHHTRLKQPEKNANPGRLPVSWEEAVQTAAEKLSACPPDRFGMLVSADCTTEDLYVAQKFTRQVMRSEHVFTSAYLRYGSGLPAVFELLRRSQPLSAITEASTILCLGLDARYTQSVVEVRLRQAKARGARIITVNAEQHSLSPFAEEWLQPLPGKETVLIRLLDGLIADQHADQAASSEHLRRAADLLRHASSLAILVGPGFLTHPDNHALLSAVEQLATHNAASVITLTGQANLSGSLLLGISPFDPARQELDVLYLVGEAVPAGLPGSPFVLYQNLYPPSAGSADLLLPTAAFTEEEGTLIDYSGRVRIVRPAVPPPGEALPAWEILCRIARQLGAPGFDFASAADIQAEIASHIPSFQPKSRVDWAFVPYLTAFSQSSVSRPASGDPTYLGYPLTDYVAGLRFLYSGNQVPGRSGA